MDVNVQYKFVCKQPGKISNIDLKFSKHFTTLEKVDVTYVTPTKQGKKTLQRGEEKLSLN